MKKMYEEYEVPIDGNKCARCGNEHVVTKQHKFNVAWFLWTLLLLAGLPFVLAGATAGIATSIGVLLILIIPALVIGVILGFIGPGKVVNLCGVCGNSWEPGKQR